MLFGAVVAVWGAIDDRFGEGGDDDEGGTVRAAISVDESLARDIAAMINEAPIRQASLLPKSTLETRDHEGAMWRIDFADAENSSAYVSLDTARFLVMRGDTWRTWDFFWMLHNMDYLNRKSFNHPLIIFVAFGALWLSGTGFYLLFKSFSRADFRWLRRRRKPVETRGAA